MADEVDYRQSLRQVFDPEKLLTLCVDRMPLAYIIWDLDFRVQEWNQAATRIFGWSSAEARGGRPGN